VLVHWLQLTSSRVRALPKRALAGTPTKAPSLNGLTSAQAPSGEDRVSDEWRILALQSLTLFQGGCSPPQVWRVRGFRIGSSYAKPIYFRCPITIRPRVCVWVPRNRHRYKALSATVLTENGRPAYSPGSRRVIPFRVCTPPQAHNVCLNRGAQCYSVEVLQVAQGTQCLFLVGYLDGS
jgi:hypothetical protein